MSASSPATARLLETIFYKNYMLEIWTDQVNFSPTDYEDEMEFADDVESAKKAIDKILGSQSPIQNNDEGYYHNISRRCEDAPCCGCCGQASYDYEY